VTDEMLDELERTMPTDKPGNVFIEGSKRLIADLRDARATARSLREELSSLVELVEVDESFHDAINEPASYVALKRSQIALEESAWLKVSVAKAGGGA
jgi:hypothetical protein